MKITKCDICKKAIGKDSEVFSLAYDSKKTFNYFDICCVCGKSLLNFLQNKKLIKNETKK